MTGSPPTIRPARTHDAGALASLITQLGYPVEAGAFSARLSRLENRPDFVSLVAEVDGEVAGLAGLQLVPSYEWDGLAGRIVAFVVDERHRRRGVGRVLLEHAERVAAEAGAFRVVVNSAMHRADAHAFYRSLGYETTGVRMSKRLR